MKFLKKNADLNNWYSQSRQLKIIPRSFDLEDLKREEFDFAKIDIEGGEAELLKLDGIKFPLVLEAHNLELRNRLAEKFGLSILVKPLASDDVWLLGNRPLHALKANNN